MFTNLAPLSDADFLRAAYHRTRKDSASGSDRVTAQDSAEHWDENLRDRYDRVRSGRYQAPPVERGWVDKEEGQKRPLGKPPFEDKLVQRAVALLLGAISEQEFQDFSSGFREGRSPHQALRELREQCLGKTIPWSIDADMSGCFASLDHDLLRDAIRHRVKDGSILRLIGRWLTAGVSDGGALTYAETGSPQGGVSTPLTQRKHLLDGKDMTDSNFFRGRIHHDFFDEKANNLLAFGKASSGEIGAHTVSESGEPFDQL